MLKSVPSLLLVAILFLPHFAVAQMVSETFQVQGAAVPTLGSSANATSTNFDQDLEPGGLYIYDVPAVTTPTADSGSSGGRRASGGSTASDDVLGPNDFISLCHVAEGRVSKRVTTVGVLITLSTFSNTAALRGHYGHDFDIIPPFLYDLGVGVESFAGKNWTDATALIHAAECQTNVPAAPSDIPEPPPAPVPPVEVPLPVCNNESRETILVTAADEVTQITAAVPAGGVRSTALSQSGRSDYVVHLRLQGLPATAAAIATEKFTAALQHAQKNKRVSSVTNSDTTNHYVGVGSASTVSTAVQPATRVVQITPGCDTADVNTIPLPAEPATSVLPVAEPTLPASEVEPTLYVSDEMTAETVGVVASGTLLTGVVLSVFDEAGDAVETFEKPVQILISNPALSAVAGADIVVLQPDVQNGWHVLPHRKTNDTTLVVELTHPGQFFVWLKPAVAVAAAPGEELRDERQLFQPVPVDASRLLWLQLIGLLTGISQVLLSAARAPFTLSRTGRLFTYGFKNLFGFLTFKKRRRPWGTVYDSVTKVPLDPAYVELFDHNGTKQADAITDLDGRYAFLVPNGEYRMQVRKTNYRFPAHARTPLNQDVLYSNLYYGEPFTIDGVVNKDIPMDPEAFDWNQHEKMRTKQTKFFHRFDPFVVFALDLFFFLGYGLLIWQYVSVQSTGALILLVLYTVLCILRFTTHRPLMYGRVSTYRGPLSFGLVKLYKGEREIKTFVIDAAGRYCALVPKDTYTVVVYERVSDTEYKPVWKQSVFARHGVINRRIRL